MRGCVLWRTSLLSPISRPTPRHDPEFRSNLHDFDYLWTVSEAETEAGAKAELIQWLLAMRGQLPAEAIRRRWQEGPKPVWLIAALNASKPGDVGLETLITATRSVVPDSPAYATASFHRVRLGKSTREELDEILANLRRTLPRSAWNPFSSAALLCRLHSRSSSSRPRWPAALNQEAGQPVTWPKEKPSQLFDVDATQAFNTALPLTRWMDAANFAKLDLHLRTRLTQAGWVRAIVSGSESLAQQFARSLRERRPGIAAFLAQ